ncbi:MAG: hypothetical protein I8H71_10160 [Xanthomonadaceae bacterium]|nr:hypothetical protein [Xanthomonadaceae bacterium]
MTFVRDQLPDAATYFGERLGWPLQGRGRWRTTACPIHGGNALRVHMDSGGFVCMAGCDFRGGDVVAAQMLLTGCDFVTVCKDLGAWVDDGKPATSEKPAPLTSRQALQVLATEANLAAIAAGNVARGVAMSDLDLARLMTASNRITRLLEAFA